jgi:hypothetical protein
MTGRFDASYYEDLRGRVRGVLIATEEFLSRQDATLIDELIDHNESGIALEMLSEMLVEASATVDPQVVEDMERLVRDMKLEPEVAQRVRKLAAT